MATGRGRRVFLALIFSSNRMMPVKARGRNVSCDRPRIKNGSPSPVGNRERDRGRGAGGKWPHPLALEDEDRLQHFDAIETFWRRPDRVRAAERGTAGELR